MAEISNDNDFVFTNPVEVDSAMSDDVLSKIVEESGNNATVPEEFDGTGDGVVDDLDTVVDDEDQGRSGDDTDHDGADDGADDGAGDGVEDTYESLLASFSNPAYAEVIPDIANLLAKSGLINSVPEDVDATDFNASALIKTIKHNLGVTDQKAYEKGYMDNQSKLVTTLSPIAKQLLSYNLDNPNADNEEIKGFFSSLVDADNISQWDAKEFPERVVREYYKSIKWSPERIERQIDNLTKEEGALVREATELKPLLDETAQKVTQQKLAAVQQMKAFEDEQQEALRGRAADILNTNVLNGVEIDQNQKRFLAAALLNNEVNVQVKGRNVQMGYAEALINRAKYDPSSNLEHLMLGLLVIQEGPNAIEKFVAKKARTKEVNRFSKEVKFSNQKTKGGVKAPRGSKLNTGIQFNFK